tara:strand:- start:4947 stop:5564 length:618 start_codon:yes stop_codon:yes gene_type:complete
MDNWLEILLSILGGGSLVGILSWVISLRKDKREGMSAVIELFKEDNTRLRDEFKELKTDFDMHRENSKKREQVNTKTIQSLQIKLNILESAHLDLPVPQWLKDKNGYMLSINSAYEEIFGITADEYVGKKDHDVWKKGIADAFCKHDNIVKRTRKHIQTQENVENEYHSGCWEVLKYPRYEGSTFIGIGGIAFKLIEGGCTSAMT